MFTGEKEYATVIGYKSLSWIEAHREKSKKSPWMLSTGALLKDCSNGCV